MGHLNDPIEDPNHPLAGRCYGLAFAEKDYGPGTIWSSDGELLYIDEATLTDIDDAIRLEERAARFHRREAQALKYCRSMVLAAQALAARNSDGPEDPGDTPSGRPVLRIYQSPEEQ